MRVLIAGATGAIGRPLVRCLIEHGHAVFALARSPQSAREVAESGAEPVTADALDAASVKAAVRRVRPNAVINELTSLPRHYTAAEMEAAADRDRKVRIEGNANLLAAVRDVGATQAELGEFLAVASTMGGCVGEMWALKAFKAYKDLANGEPATSTVTEEPGCCSSH
jgi:nucleoside-diphosphate-sugar epimerase